jgi:hypothetical protein
LSPHGFRSDEFQPDALELGALRYCAELALRDCLPPDGFLLSWPVPDDFLPAGLQFHDSPPLPDPKLLLPSAT